MRIPFVVFAGLLAVAVPAAAPAQGRTPADPTTIREGWAESVARSLADPRPTPHLHWHGVSRDGQYLMAWVKFWHVREEPVPGDTARFNQRYIKYRFDCAGPRLQRLATLWYRDGFGYYNVRVAADQRPAPWMAPDTTAAERGLMELACLPRPLGGGSPMAIPPARFVDVGPQPGMAVDTGARVHHGRQLMVWMRQLYGEPRRTLREDTEFDWTLVDCDTYRMRTLRSLGVKQGVVVDSLSRPSASVTGWAGSLHHAMVDTACAAAARARRR